MEVNRLKKNFVSKNIAKQLNKFGFDCYSIDAVYIHNNDIAICMNDNIVIGDYNRAILYTDAIEWFINKHNIFIKIDYDFYIDGINYTWQVLKYDNSNHVDCCDYSKCSGIYGDNGEYKTIQEAYDKAILKALSYIN